MTTFALGWLFKTQSYVVANPPAQDVEARHACLRVAALPNLGSLRWLVDAAVLSPPSSVTLHFML
jgi:hypothetical protein